MKERELTDEPIFNSPSFLHPPLQSHLFCNPNLLQTPLLPSIPIHSCPLLALLTDPRVVLEMVLLPFGGLVNSWLKGGHTEVKQRSNGGFIHGLDAQYPSHPLPSV